MATTTRPRYEPTGNGTRPRRPQLDQRADAAAAGARNRSRILLGVLVTLGCGLVTALLYADAGERTSVLVVARPVAAGQVVEAADLRDTTVAVDGEVRVVPADQRAVIVGRTATVALAEGALLGPDQVGDGPLIDSTAAVFGAVLADGSYPAGLREGDGVLLFVLPSAADPKEAAPVAATVVSLSEGVAPATVNASFGVAPGDAGAMAVASGQNRLIVVLAPR